MIEEKFKLLDSKLFKLVNENAALKTEMQVLKEQLSQAVQDSGVVIQSLQDENELIKSRNAELTMHLKKIMSRLESLGVQ